MFAFIITVIIQLEAENLKGYNISREIVRPEENFNYEFIINPRAASSFLENSQLLSRNNILRYDPFIK